MCLLVRGHYGVRRPAPTRSGDTTDSVDKHFGFIREVDVDDISQEGNINTSGCHIRYYHNLDRKKRNKVMKLNIMGIFKYQEKKEKNNH